MANKFRRILLISVLSLTAALQADSKKPSLSEYQEMILSLPGSELQEAIKKDSRFRKLQFEQTKDNALLYAIKYQCSMDTINAIMTSGIRVTDKNVLKQDALIYSSIYSANNPELVDFIVDKYGNEKNLLKAMNFKDSGIKTAFEYALENQNAQMLEKFSTLLSPEQKELINQEEEKKAEELEKKRLEEEKKAEEQRALEEARLLEEQRIREEEEKQALLDMEAQKQAAVIYENESSFKKIYLYDYEKNPEDILPEEDKKDQLELASIKNPNAKDENGRTPLMHSSKIGNDWEIRSLIKSGAEINLQDFEGWTSLMYAIRYQNNVDIVNLLLKYGADVKIVNRYGNNALQIAACYSNNPEILKKIINEYTPGSTDIFKSFILAITSSASSELTQLSKLNIFIDKSVSMNRFYEGKTPLMYACEYATSTKIIRLLLENGAIPTMRDSTGKTAFDYATENTKLDHDDIYWSLNRQ